jgi:hypothetical protein
LAVAATLYSKCYNTVSIFAAWLKSNAEITTKPVSHNIQITIFRKYSITTM